MTGHALPSWLVNKDKALVRKQVRQSKYDDWVEECEIIHVTPSYAQIQTESGKEQTVSLRDLAPLPAQENIVSDGIRTHPAPVTDDSNSNKFQCHMPDSQQNLNSPPVVNPTPYPTPQIEPIATPIPSSQLPNQSNSEVLPRRSTRQRNEPSRLTYSNLGGTNTVIANVMNLFY